MRKLSKRVAAGAVALALMAAAPAAYAAGGPNSPGNSGHFNPNSGPCQGPNDQPNCPSPTH
jgi:Spy/CpxP family protein refolding chaperone